MRAVAIRESGGPEVLEIVERPDPQPHGAEVRVRVRAAALNRADLLQRAGRYPALPGVPRDIPGLEYAGVVDAVGSAAHMRSVGDRVMGLVGGGAYADYVVVHERETIRVPDGYDFVRAAAIPEAFLTAYRALFLVGGLRAGGSLLIRAATSGVGIAAVQLAHMLGCVTMGTSRSGERLARLQSLGLHAGYVEGDGRLSDAVHRQFAGNGADVVVDLLGGGHLQENLDALRDEGRMVLVGLMAGSQDKINLGRLLMRRQSVCAMTMRSLPPERRIALARDFDTRLVAMFSDGRLEPIVENSLPLEQAADAHRAMAAGQHFGKLVLRLEQ